MVLAGSKKATREAASGQGLVQGHGGESAKRDHVKKEKGANAGKTASTGTMVDLEAVKQKSADELRKENPGGPTVELTPDDKVPEAKDPLLLARNIYCIYGGREKANSIVALRGMNLKIMPGEFVSIVGPSGSGKSSLLRILGGLQFPSAGQVIYDGLDITRLNESDLVPFRRQTVGYIFQEGNLLPTLSAYQNVVQTLDFAGVPASEGRRRAIEILELLGLKDRMHDLPPRLSGGERQRVAIARALANNPRIILADEPTGNLDYANAENVMAIMNDLRKKLKTAFLVVTHSQHVASFTDRSLELRDGRFIGQHGTDIDLKDFNATRRVLVAPDGTLTLPPETLPVIERYGDVWDFKIDLDLKGVPTITGRPASASAEGDGSGGGDGVVKVGEAIVGEENNRCPVCEAPYKAGEFHCRSCGAKLQK